MLIEVMEWVELANQFVANESNLIKPKNVSNVIFLLYAITYMFNKKSCFIVAFLLCEIAGVSYNLTPEYGYNLFLVYAFIYSILLIKLKTDNYTNKKLHLGVIIMILFQGTMAIDTFIYYETETVLYNLYIYIVIAFHLLIIFALSKWRFNWAGLASYIRDFLSKHSLTYNMCIFWYNNKNKLQNNQR